MLFLRAILSNHTVAQTSNFKSINGIWMGKLVLPNGVETRIAITFSDNTYATLNIIDQANIGINHCEGNPGKIP